MVLISAIIENQKENTMSSKSLSIVFLPSFFEKVVNITDIKELPYFVELLEIMILNAKFLVEPDIFKNIEETFNDIGKELVIQSTHLEEEKPLSNLLFSSFSFIFICFYTSKGKNLNMLYRVTKKSGVYFNLSCLFKKRK